MPTSAVSEAAHAGAPTARRAYDDLYLVLAGIFIASLVACNLIFLKFFQWTVPLPWGGSHAFELSVGIIPYPVTFLVTDVLSEVYGRRAANRVVTSGLVASLFTVLIILAADAARAGPSTVVDDATFHRVFGLQWAAVAASMGAYLAAQYLDIRFFHFWRRVTKGRHLWLRNNASTMCSQVIDTFTVLGLLILLSDSITPAAFPRLFADGVAFKIVVAALDTPFFYAAVIACRRRFPLEMALVEAEEERGWRGRSLRRSP